MGAADLHRPEPAPTREPGPRAQRSAQAQAKTSRQQDEHGQPVRSFQSLLAHLATLTRNDVRFAGATTTVPILAEPTPVRRQAFDLIGTPIPLTLK